MQNLQDKVVLITGASSGIGYACAQSFAALGASLILVARRTERLQALAAELEEKHAIKVLPLALDLTDANAVEQVMAGLDKPWSSIDILVNNAGLARGVDPLAEGNCAEWDQMIQTNFNGLLYMTRACLPGMQARQSGHIINIGSVSGLEDAYPGGAVYCATKHAVHALTKGLRIDSLGSHVRITEVDPGVIETEFTKVRWRGDAKHSDDYYEINPALVADDVADAVIYAATRRAEVNIEQLVVMHVDQASVNHNLKKGN